MRLHQTYLLPDLSTGENLVQQLKDNFAVEKKENEHARETAFDTFDWRLFNEGLVLLGRGEEFFLQRLEDSSVLARARFAGNSVPQFWQDFPPGELRERLKKMIDVRALQPRVTLDRDSQPHECRNADRKTVLRLRVESLAVANGNRPIPLCQTLQVVSLKGYESAAERVHSVAGEYGLQPEEQPRHPVLLGYQAVGDRPGSYSSKIDLQLHALMSAREAARAIHRSSLEVMRQNIDGIVDDIDSEFLHDFRVALRRSRSALSLLPDVFPPKESKRLKDDLQKLQKHTNALRDLDVYLVAREEYRAMLPDSLRESVDTYFDDLRRERLHEQRKIARALRNQKTREILDHFEAVIENPDLPDDECPQARTPVRTLATELLRKRLDKILKRGAKLTLQSPDDDFHSVRIDCKKMRYLLEFFRSLYPAEIEILVKRLRKLQNVLGEFNDACVQIERLENYLKEVPPAKPDSIHLAAALGSLIGQLSQRKHESREAFSRAFEELSSPKVKAVRDKLFLAA